MDIFFFPKRGAAPVKFIEEEREWNREEREKQKVFSFLSVVQGTCPWQIQCPWELRIRAQAGNTKQKGEGNIIDV